MTAHPGTWAVQDGIGFGPEIEHSSSYLAGSLLTIEFACTDEVLQALADPTVVTLSVSIDEGPSTVYTYGVGSVIVRDSTGSYHVELDSTGLSGTWLYAVRGTGSVQAIAVSGFVVVDDPT